MPRGWKDFTVPTTIEAVTVETLPVDIKAQTIEQLRADIAAQTLENLSIDVKAQSVAIKLLTDWSAIEFRDVDVTGVTSAGSGVEMIVLGYTVPSDKKLLIYDWSVALRTGDGQLFGYLYNATDGMYLSCGAGMRGFQVSLSKPKRVPGGKVVRIYARQDTGATRDVMGHFGGVLI